MVKSKAQAGQEQRNIYVIAGKEESLVDCECEKLIEKLVDAGDRATGLLRLEGKEADIADVLDELRTIPFLASRRVVVIKRAEDFISGNRELLEKYFDSPSKTGTLVFTSQSWASNTRLARKLKKAGELISVSAPRQWELPGRLCEYAREAHGKNMGREAAELLIEAAGEELVLLYGEIDKLSVYVNETGAISSDDIEALVGHNRLFNVFSVIDEMTAGRMGRAIEQLRNMFEADRSAEYSAVGAFAFHFRRMFNAKVLLEKGLRQGEIAGRCKIWGNKEAFFAQVGRMNLKDIGSMLERLAETDYAIKRGGTKAPVAIEKLVLSIGQ